MDPIDDTNKLSPAEQAMRAFFAACDSMARANNNSNLVDTWVKNYCENAKNPDAKEQGVFVDLLSDLLETAFIARTEPAHKNQARSYFNHTTLAILSRPDIKQLVMTAAVSSFNKKSANAPDPRESPKVDELASADHETLLKLWVLARLSPSWEALKQPVYEHRQKILEQHKAKYLRREREVEAFELDAINKAFGFTLLEVTRLYGVFSPGETNALLDMTSSNSQITTAVDLTREHINNIAISFLKYIVSAQGANDNSQFRLTEIIRERFAEIDLTNDTRNYLQFRFADADAAKAAFKTAIAELENLNPDPLEQLESYFPQLDITTRRRAYEESLDANKLRLEKNKKFAFTVVFAVRAYDNDLSLFNIFPESVLCKKLLETGRKFRKYTSFRELSGSDVNNIVQAYITYAFSLADEATPQSDGLMKKIIAGFKKYGDRYKYDREEQEISTIVAKAIKSATVHISEIAAVHKIKKMLAFYVPKIENLNEDAMLAQIPDEKKQRLLNPGVFDSANAGNTTAFTAYDYAGAFYGFLPPASYLGPYAVDVSTQHPTADARYRHTKEHAEKKTQQRAEAQGDDAGDVLVTATEGTHDIEMKPL